MKINGKIIKVPSGAIQKLMDATGTSMCGVYNALAYRNNSEAAKIIRARALSEFGGKKIDKIVKL